MSSAVPQSFLYGCRTRYRYTEGIGKSAYVNVRALYGKSEDRCIRIERYFAGRMDCLTINVDRKSVVRDAVLIKKT